MHRLRIYFGIPASIFPTPQNGARSSIVMKGADISWFVSMDGTRALEKGRKESKCAIGSEIKLEESSSCIISEGDA